MRHGHYGLRYVLGDSVFSDMVPYLRSTFWSCFCIPYSVFVFAPLFALLVTVIVRPHSYSVFRIRIRINDGSHILGAYPLVVDIVGDISAPAHDIMYRYDIMGPPVIAGDSDITGKLPMISLT